MRTRQWFGSTVYYDGEVTLVVFPDGTGLFSSGKENVWKGGKFIYERKVSKKDIKGIARAKIILCLDEEWS